MITTPCYSCQIKVSRSGKHTIKNNFSYWNGINANEMINADITQSLIRGESITLKKSSILVNICNSADRPTVKQLINLANQILQDDFKMDCDDAFGLHRSIVAKSIHIYPCDTLSNIEFSFQIQFDMSIKLATPNSKKLIKKINRDGFVALDSHIFKNFMEALKLVHDNPCKYEISNMQGEYWIRYCKFETKKLWNYYAKQIWDSTNYSDCVIRLIQMSCPDRKLRKRLKEIDILNDSIIDNFQGNLKEKTAKLRTLQKLLEQETDRTDIKKQAGLYIIQQIRENPEKYLNSNLPFIKEIAEDIIHTAQS